MQQFYTLRVADIKPETQDSIVLTLDVPDDLMEKFSFAHGQYLTFRAMIEGEEVRRSYSICESPLEQRWRVGIKHVPGGKFSTFAHKTLQVGNTLDVLPPMGRFTTKIDASSSKNYVAFAAGSGITPIMSIIKTILNLEPKSHFTLFYSNKSSESIMFRSELEDLKNIFLKRFSLHHILTQEKLESPLFQGRLDENKCKAFSKVFFQPLSISNYFICGPEEMIFTIKNCLEDMGVETRNILFELFGTAQKTKKKRTSSRTDANSTEMSLVTLQTDGLEFHFEMPKDEKSVLDAALDQGADLPFACKGGVCCTCRAKVLNGEVHMNVNYGLEPDEIEAGYILACQAHPVTSELSITFDA